MLNENPNCTVILYDLSCKIIGNYILYKKNRSGQRIEIYSFQDTLFEPPFLNILVAKWQ